ncbi:MAG: hypothetical protein HFF34_03750 [Oscillospiraceae bacterium]|jgi:hypothetical protein|nr:hypothetical protein [Oscillospiraceae bacterium]MCI9394762.1 hypothetical protein [Oscillospiraceae bacterium]MCI9580473.1 hypothetical protein [Oscillospiraceae bacterium]
MPHWVSIACVDIDKYKGVCDYEIRSSALILTDKQKSHIIDRRGQEFFDRYSPFFQEVAEQPDYIFKDNRHRNTAIACKTLAVDGVNVNLVIRFAVEGDDSSLENSIITAILESDKRYRQRIRNNPALYKKS